MRPCGSAGSTCTWPDAGTSTTQPDTTLIHPRGTQVFRGAYHHDLLRGTDRILTWMPAISDILPEGDFREWDAIDAWADAVADELGAASRTSG